MEAALAAEAAGNPYDVILTDMQMPVMDGYTATTKLREAGNKHPIIALTAHAMTEDCNRCLESGCDAYGSKPVNRKVLLGLVDQYSNVGEQSVWNDWVPTESPSV